MEMKISHIYIQHKCTYTFHAGNIETPVGKARKTFSVSKAPRQSDAFKLPDVESTAKSLITKVT